MIGHARREDSGEEFFYGRDTEHTEHYRRRLIHQLERLGHKVTLESQTPPEPTLSGGAQIREKLGLVWRFLELADVVCLGGAVCFPFLAALGHGVSEDCISQLLADEPSSPLIVLGARSTPELVAVAVNGHQTGRDAALPPRIARAHRRRALRTDPPVSLGVHHPSEVVAGTIRGTSRSIVAGRLIHSQGHFAANREITRNM